MPNRHNLEQLAAIAQLYGAIAGPQEREQQARQQAALQLIGLMHQQESEKAMQAFRQEQESNRQGEFWQGQYPLEEQRAADSRQLREDEIAQRAQAGQWHADEVGRQKNLDAQNAALTSIKLATMQGTPVEKAMTMFGTPEMQGQVEHVHQKALEEALPDATKKAETVFKLPPGATRDVGWATLHGQNPAMDLVDFSNPSLYSHLPEASAPPVSTNLDDYFTKAKPLDKRTQEAFKAKPTTGIPEHFKRVLDFLATSVG